MNELKDRFHSEFPGAFFLSDVVSETESFLKQKRWLSAEEKIESLEKPGEGNMNYVVRVKTNKQSFILKQARPWVEKYPHIDAPIERNSIEACYFKTINIFPDLKAFSPELIASDPDNFISAFSDLGEGADFTYLYKQGKHLETHELDGLLKYLSTLHKLDQIEFPSNKKMRELNHVHIFHIPYQEDNGLNLDNIQEGLQAASSPYKKNKLLKKNIRELGELYLSEGPILIHGDYFPGSWLKTETGIKIIDPEFSFKGFAEYDLGVLCAHMAMAQQEENLIMGLLNHYKKPDHFEEQRYAGFAGVEILRRILGVGQLPLSLTLKEKTDLMETASGWILNRTIDF